MESFYCTCEGPCTGACGATVPVRANGNHGGMRFVPRRVSVPGCSPGAAQSRFDLVDTMTNTRLLDLQGYCAKVRGDEAYVRAQADYLNGAFTFVDVPEPGGAAARFQVAYDREGNHLILDTHNGRGGANFLMPMKDGVALPPFSSIAQAKQWLRTHRHDIGHYTCPTGPAAVREFQRRSPEARDRRDQAARRRADAAAARHAARDLEAERAQLAADRQSLERAEAEFAQRAGGAPLPMRANPAAAGEQGLQEQLQSLTVRVDALEGEVAAVSQVNSDLLETTRGHHLALTRSGALGGSAGALPAPAPTQGAAKSATKKGAAKKSAAKKSAAKKSGAKPKKKAASRGAAKKSGAKPRKKARK